MMRILNLMNDTSGEPLRYALLVYEDGQNVGATMHGVSDGKEGMYIEPGRPVEASQFLDIAKRISGAPSTQKRTMLDPGLLVADPDLLIWYRPSHRQTMFWKTARKDLDALNGKSPLHPALLFVARDRVLHLYALASDERPMLETPLYRAPYYNIYLGGHLCEGNIKLPDHYRPDGIPGWERAFFDTNFAHTNVDGRNLTSFPGGHTALWQALSVGRGHRVIRQFDAKWLVALKDGSGKKALTLEAVVNNGRK